jgi:hypothetical protein
MDLPPVEAPEPEYEAGPGDDEDAEADTLIIEGEPE